LRENKIKTETATRPWLILISTLKLQ
jgi:hypothetical protein